MPWLPTVDCFLLGPLLEPSISFPFLLDVIDLVDLVWVLGRVRVLVRFWLGKVGLVMGIGKEIVVFGLGF